MPKPGGALRPGMYVTARLVLPPQPNALVVPTTAIQTSASGDSVVLVRGGKAAPVPVTTGRRLGDKVVIASGVKAGDVVVTDGQLRVQPGAPVKVQMRDG
jgi:multidrug efflux system membrane fusion protein